MRQRSACWRTGEGDVVLPVVVHEGANGGSQAGEIWRCNPGQITPGRALQWPGYADSKAPSLQGLGQAVRCRRAAAQRECDALAMVTRLCGSIGVAESLSASYGPSSSNLFQCEIVSSKLVTLPLGPRTKIEG